jgi:hypothetical protein
MVDPAVVGGRRPAGLWRDDLRGHASGGRDALAARRGQTWIQPSRDALLRSLVGRPQAEPLTQLIAIADTHKIARLRPLRALRDFEEAEK